jgi:hypothetical protein
LKRVDLGKVIAGNTKQLDRENSAQLKIHFVKHVRPDACNTHIDWVA